MAKVVIYAAPENLTAAARCAQRVLSPEYAWPSDNIALFGQHVPANGLFQPTFAVKRNKAGITVWDQQA